MSFWLCIYWWQRQFTNVLVRPRKSQWPCRYQYHLSLSIVYVLQIKMWHPSKSFNLLLNFQALVYLLSDTRMPCICILCLLDYTRAYHSWLAFPNLNPFLALSIFFVHHEEHKRRSNFCLELHFLSTKLFILHLEWFFPTQSLMECKLEQSAIYRDCYWLGSLEEVSISFLYNQTSLPSVLFHHLQRKRSRQWSKFKKEVLCAYHSFLVMTPICWFLNQLTQLCHAINSHLQ